MFKDFVNTDIHVDVNQESDNCLQDIKCACSGELGADKATGTKRNRRVRRSKAGSAMDDPGESSSSCDRAEAPFLYKQ